MSCTGNSRSAGAAMVKIRGVLQHASQGVATIVFCDFVTLPTTLLVESKHHELTFEKAGLPTFMLGSFAFSVAVSQLATIPN